MHHHAGLRERKGEERAHGVQRNQAVGNAAERRSTECAGENRQRVDSLRINQPAAAQRETVRQESVLGDGARQAREIGKRGVGGEASTTRIAPMLRPVERARGRRQRAINCESTL